MSVYAVIKTGGKQYKVSPGNTLKVEKLTAEPGDTIEISNVLLIVNNNTVNIGTPRVPGARVVVSVIDEGRRGKVLTIKMKRRKGYKKTIGHRQYFTTLKVDQIFDGENSYGEQDVEAQSSAPEQTKAKVIPKKNKSAASKIADTNNVKTNEVTDTTSPVALPQATVDEAKTGDDQLQTTNTHTEHSEQTEPDTIELQEPVTTAPLTPIEDPDDSQAKSNDVRFEHLEPEESSPVELHEAEPVPTALLTASENSEGIQVHSDYLQVDHTVSSEHDTIELQEPVTTTPPSPTEDTESIQAHSDYLQVNHTESSEHDTIELQEPVTTTPPSPTEDTESIQAHSDYLRADHSQANEAVSLNDFRASASSNKKYWMAAILLLLLLILIRWFSVASNPETLNEPAETEVEEQVIQEPEIVKPELEVIEPEPEIIEPELEVIEPELKIPVQEAHKPVIPEVKLEETSPVAKPSSPAAPPE